MSVVSENGRGHVRSSNDALNRTVLRSSQRVPGTRRCHWKGSVADRGPAG